MTTTHSITVRKLPAGVARAVQDRARKHGTSLGRAAAELLAEATGNAPRPEAPQRFDDLDEFAGSWSAREARSFERELIAGRAIDPEDWR